MPGHDPRSDETLVAYLDGELDAVEAGVVEALLASDAALAARLAVLDRGKLAFRDAFAPLLDQTPVAALAAALPMVVGTPTGRAPAADTATDTAATTRARVDRRMVLAGAAACVALGVLGDRGLGALSRGLDRSEGWRAAVANYMRLYSVDTLDVAVDRSAETAQLARIGGTMGLAISAGTTDIPGFTLKRAQMLRYGGEPLARIAYLDPVYGPSAFCFRRAGAGPAASRVEDRYGLNIVYWSSATHAFLLIGARPAGELAARVEALRRSVSA